MKPNFALLFIVSFLTASCHSDAFTYNQKIAALEASLSPSVNEATQEIIAGYRSGNFERVARTGGIMERKVQEKIDELKRMLLPKAKGAAQFKQEAIRYFSFVKLMYTYYRELGEQKDKEGRERINLKLDEMVRLKNYVISDLRSAQEKFAEENGESMNR